ncbi:MAG TPA: cytochrome C oxidase subunit IV family protein [Mycobacterium sp.]|jgi:hypothetical protein|uniref:cytochrome C oxidase subunit IV family protein n=1 Tax=Mycobacterium sp. TaxID=1785 RepID=UPI002F41E78E
MTTTAARTTTYAWVVLSVITIVSWWLAPGHAHGAAVPSVPITLAVTLLAFIKGRVIIRYFMEVRAAPRWLKLFTDAWLATLWAGVLAIYLY